MQDYINTSDIRVNNGRDGVAFGGIVESRHLLTERVTASFALLATGKSAVEGYEAYAEAGVSAGVTYAFSGPFAGAPGPWVAGLNGTLLRRGYTDPDPDIDRFDAQNDWRLNVAGSLEIPLTNILSLATEVGYTRNDSTYAVDEYDDVYGKIVVQARF